jgi:hypothetical protein
VQTVAATPPSRTSDAGLGKATGSVSHFSYLSLQALLPSDGGGGDGSSSPSNAGGGGGVALVDTAGEGNFGTGGDFPAPDETGGGGGGGAGAGAGGGEGGTAVEYACGGWSSLPIAGTGSFPTTLSAEQVWPVGDGHQFFSNDLHIEPCTLLTGSLTAWDAMSLGKNICAGTNCAAIFSCENRDCTSADSFCYSHAGVMQACTVGKPGTDCRGIGSAEADTPVCTGQLACSQSDPVSNSFYSGSECNDGHAYGKSCDETSSTQCGCTCSKDDVTFGACSYAKQACSTSFAPCACTFPAYVGL